MWKTILDVKTSQNRPITIRCNDAGVRWPAPLEARTTDTKTKFTFDGFRNLGTNQAITVDLTSTDVSLPRRTFCEQGASMWTVSRIDTQISELDKNKKAAIDGTEQAVIMICPNELNPPHSIGDTRLVSGSAVMFKIHGFQTCSEGGC
jgi:hypothetical protein